ncbi:Protein dumpy-20 [Eumeta japonica]|uniref:Protein dumpy-20 n=1 Tax=Eumeta variegata TaxID=151549 RepID=A0A4C1VC64_EUMVA|nr:Protein dumpy-20 [Eumeta japonica]
MFDFSARPARSPMWRYFTKLDDKFANCELCSKRLSFKSTVSNLVKHLSRRHAAAYAAMRRAAAADQGGEYVVFSGMVVRQTFGQTRPMRLDVMRVKSCAAISAHASVTRAKCFNA